MEAPLPTTASAGLVKKKAGFDANVMGLTQKEADLACSRLQAKGVQCFTMGQ